jgi:hypothetical protein
MKTTIDISDSLMSEARALAQKRGVTFRALVEQGLRDTLNQSKPARHSFTLRDASFAGSGGLADITRVSDPATWREAANPAAALKFSPVKPSKRNAK